MIKANKSLQILVVDDNIGDARLIAELLKDTDLTDYELTYLVDDKGLEELNRTVFDVILLDLHLSEATPLMTYKLFHKAFPKTPIIVLTGLDDDDMAIKIVSQGAQDYLIKGTFGPSTLQRSIKYSIERMNTQLRLSRSKRKSQKLEADAVHLRGETQRLKKLNEAKDVFLSIASHQLRTPATAVKQYLGMLLEGFGGAVADGQRHFLETAYNSNERQLKIVDDLLKVARLDAGNVKLNIAEVELNDLIQRTINDQLKCFTDRNQTVVFTPSKEPIHVGLDEANMRMVYENILDNASKYSPVGEKIFVTVTKNKNTVQVDIKDSGIGIPKNEFDKLFDKFSRVTNSFRHSPDGSGLGLYWAKKIVNLHGGTISVNSTVGKGTVFSIRIPHQLQESEKAELAV